MQGKSQEKNESFSELLFRERKAKGWSQERLAEISGVSSATICRIEKGGQPNNFESTRNKLLTALGLEAIEVDAEFNKQIIQELIDHLKAENKRLVDDVERLRRENDALRNGDSPKKAKGGRS